MKRNITKILAILATGSLSIFSLVGCGSSKVSGTISLAGSTSMEKVCEALMEGFMESNPDVTVTTEYTGSGAGLESLNAGSVDIGNASRHVKG